MNIQIRPMVNDDLQIVSKMEQEIFTDPWPVKSFEVELKNHHISYPCVIAGDGIIYGYAIVWHYAGDVHISNIAIGAEYRRMGLASKMLVHILERFADHDTALLEVRESNHAAIQLYKKFGFNPLHRRPHYYSNGESAIVMVKPLKSS
ncbi:MAG: ribosomal-protein-alanine N-acetyltransferase [Caldithrix sp.]|nr:ribosomal-protein-alanine N-acetyltransferase [Caldithrix sp.]